MAVIVEGSHNFNRILSVKLKYGQNTIKNK
jgi:hypothetical protein